MEFHEGQKVRITSKFGQARDERTIVKVLKTRVVLDNGERYNLDGTIVGSRGYLARTITAL